MPEDMVSLEPDECFLFWRGFHCTAGHGHIIRGPTIYVHIGPSVVDWPLNKMMDNMLLFF